MKRREGKQDKLNYTFQASCSQKTNFHQWVGLGGWMDLFGKANLAPLELDLGKNLILFSNNK